MQCMPCMHGEYAPAGVSFWSALALSVLVSYHLSRRVCVAILRHNAESSCWRARATLQLATVMHSIQGCQVCLFKTKFQKFGFFLSGLAVKNGVWPLRYTRQGCFVVIDAVRLLSKKTLRIKGC